MNDIAAEHAIVNQYEKYACLLCAYLEVLQWSGEKGQNNLGVITENVLNDILIRFCL